MGLEADIISADMILTSLGSDEAVEEVFTELFAGQEVGQLLHPIYDRC